MRNAFYESDSEADTSSVEDDVQKLLNSNSAETRPEPPDKYNVAWFIFLLLGVGILFPWNAFLTAFDYFHNLYPDEPFQFALSLAYNYPSIVFLLITIKFGRRFSFGQRIVTGFGIGFGFVVFIPIISKIGLATKVSFWITLGGVFISGCANAMLFGTVLGLAALFPLQYTGAVMSGAGVAGVVVGILRIITKLALPDELFLSSVIYFAITGATLLVCIVSYYALLRLPIAQYYMAKEKSDSIRIINETSDDGSTSSTALLNFNKKPVRYLDLFGRVWKEAIVVFGIFFVTLSLFPGISSEIKTSTSLSADWFIILMNFTFQVFDFVGRTLPRFVILFSKRTLWIPSALRFAFFILFIFCIKPHIFHSDGFAYSFMVVFALSNGYLGTLAMMYGPVNALEHEKEVAGAVMSFFLNLGIFTAVNFAFLLLFLVTGQSPIS